MHLTCADDSDDVLIAIMGPTRSGKTTFINLASKSKSHIDPGSESCVQAAAPFMLDGHRITLIDTPGFDDATQDRETGILRMIAIYLSTAYENGRKLAGIVYFHKISDFNIGGISRRNFKMFTELCGNDSLKNVLIVTNMWGEVDPQVGLTREKELSSKDIYFKLALDEGARIFRHASTVESTYNIIRQVIKCHPVTLQNRAVDQGDIPGMAPGIELKKELLEQAEKHRKEMIELQREMTETIKFKDEEIRRLELENETSNLRQEIRHVQTEYNTLSENFKLEKTKMEAHVKEIIEAMQREAQKAEEARQRHLNILEQQLGSTKVSTAHDLKEIKCRQRELGRILAVVTAQCFRESFRATDLSLISPSEKTILEVDVSHILESSDRYRGLTRQQLKINVVSISIDSKDQGWSVFTNDQGTYKNSWTWFELELWNGASFGDKPIHKRELYRNRHAGREFEKYTFLMGPSKQSDILREFWQRMTKVQSPVIRLKAIANDPGWVNNIRSAEIELVWSVDLDWKDEEEDKLDDPTACIITQC